MRRLPSVLAAVVGVLATLPVVSGAAATPTITQVSPTGAEINTFQTFTFTTVDTYSSTVKPKLTITRSATAAGSSHETLTADSNSVVVNGNKVSGQFNLTLANPGPYDAAVTGPTTSPPSPSTADTCTSCLTLT